jgi:3-oxoacyl-[acyl-carrier-protein] synthase II
LGAIITSLGAVTGHGIGAGRLFSALLQGASAVGPVTRFPVEGLCSDIAVECPPDAELVAAFSGLSPVRPEDRATRLLLAAAADAFRGRDFAPSRRRGAIVATTKGAFELLERPGGEKDLLGSPARSLARATGACGPTFGLSAACASGAAALGEALALIESGLCDEVVVGGVDALHGFVYRGFHALRALSPRPAMPFDASRSGLTLGEGAAVLLVESSTSAARSGRDPLAVLEAFASCNDCFDQVSPEPGGRGLLTASRRALASAHVAAEEVGVYQAHGTGTVQNDRMEARVVGALFDGCPVSVTAIKGSIGHTLGAAAALEAVVGTFILQTRTVPPVANLSRPDPRAAVPAVLGEPQLLGRGRLLLGSAGFGGINSAIVLGAASGTA